MTDEEVLTQSLDNQRALLREFGPGLTLAGAMTFFAIALKKETTQTKIAKFTGLSKYAVHRAVNTLEAANLVVLSPVSLVNAREKKVSLSPKGQKRLESLLLRLRNGSRKLRPIT